MKKRLILTLACSALVACGDGDGDNGSDNSGTNGAANNTSANNTSANNTSANNTSANNTSANNTSANGTNVTCNPDFGAADACGGPEGDEAASWTVQDVCSNFDYEAMLQEACPEVTVSDTRYEVTGGLDATAGLFVTAIIGELEADANVPDACAQLVGGCPGVEEALQEIAFDASCTAGTDGCDCTATFEVDHGSSGGYEVADGVATVSDGSEWYYCIEGDTMTLRENGDDSRDRPTFVLTR